MKSVRRVNLFTRPRRFGKTLNMSIEGGEGFSDIIIETENPDAGIIIELKYVKRFVELDRACEKVILQIKDRRYDEYLQNDGHNDILYYGIAFCKKRCRVVTERVKYNRDNIITLS